MSNDSLTHGKLERLRRRCDQLLDGSSTIRAFAQSVVEALVEIEGLDAAAVVDILSQQDQRILAAQSLERLSVDGFYSLDPDHQSLILECLRQQKLALVPERSVPEAGLKQHSLLMAPMRNTEGPHRVLELFRLNAFRPDEAAHLREVAETVVSYFRKFEQDQAARGKAAPADNFWQSLDLFLIKLQQSLDLKQTVAVATNDGRLLIGCDRVSLALKHGVRTKIYGISGQEGVQHRANLVKAMTRLSHEVMQTGNALTYKGIAEELPPQLEVPLAEYLAESRTRMVHFLPLREPAPLMPDEDETKPRQQPPERKVLGVMIVEQAAEARPKPGVLDKAELIAHHVEVAVANCERHETIFLLPVWRTLGRGLRWFKGRRLWTAIAIVLGVIAVGLGLWLIPWDYRVQGAGLAMPVIQHEVFAPWDGDVREVLVESGQRVTAGTLLLRLESDELDAEKIQIENELQEKQKLLAALTQQENVARRKNDVDELTKIVSEFVKTGIEVEGAESRLKKIKSRIEKLNIKAPADGVVATFQVRQLLQNRPVKRGELLMEVMEPDGPWRLELEVPEYRMGHLMQALNASPDHTLPVEYVLATAVEKGYPGTLKLVGTRSNESQEEGTIVEVYADIDAKDLPAKNIGSEVTAKINCGKKSLFYVLFGDVVEFVQRYLWL
ncbi:HlyD family efflux transporter periplasmic adaptor subunit [Planctomicrobium piriforme]|uniref:HlyD family secretion protein n=1 Tax=Planctomicrobium piriforme TaxID=1576369 RepID=A0A1I3G590_9PLAN|nr:HlyD family efflux transporter periplasmic adaptor subunit [Planctomicrobium piriforme]SFI18604.1 HlyD family secretion protein [Planctomicrobium piriforme]